MMTDDSPRFGLATFVDRQAPIPAIVRRLLPQFTARVRLAAVGSLLAVMACDDDTPAQPPAFGGIQVASVTTGQDLDNDGYLVDVDLGVTVVLPTNGGVAFTDLAPGSHDLRMSGIATNCTVGGGVNQRVNVTAGEVTTVRLTITCLARVGEAPPAEGTLEVRTSTTGIELDPNGYSVLVSNAGGGEVTSLFLPITGSILVDLAPGAFYLVVLNGLAPNCHVVDDGSLTRTVSVVANETIRVTFAILCQPAYPTRLPAGSQLAFVRDGRIHLVNSDGTGIVKLTDGPADCDPAWSPDGTRIAFVRGCGGLSSNVYVMNADGSNLVRRAPGADPSWSPDGSKIVFAAVGFGSSNLYVVGSDSLSQAVTELVVYGGWEAQPSWSPDGKTIAFVSDREFYDFTADVFVLSVSDQSIKRLTSAISSHPFGQFYEPTWSHDGTKLAVDKCVLEFYICDSGTLAVMSADGSGVRDLAFIRSWASPTWSPDDRTIAFSVGNIISWIHADGSARGFIIDNGHSPAWRPLTTANLSQVNAP